VELPVLLFKIHTAMFKKISASMFALILICFFLPFMSLSCQGKDIVTMTGLQMATGVEIANPAATLGGSLGNAASAAKPQKIAGSVPMGIAFVTAAAGLAATLLLKDRFQKSLVPGVASGIGAIILLFVKSGADSEVMKQGSGMIQVSYGIGFYLALLLFIANAGVNGYQFMEERKQK
jgi:hypothetical protein